MTKGKIRYRSRWPKRGRSSFACQRHWDWDSRRWWEASQCHRLRREKLRSLCGWNRKVPLPPTPTRTESWNRNRAFSLLSLFSFLFPSNSDFPGKFGSLWIGRRTRLKTESGAWNAQVNTIRPFKIRISLFAPGLPFNFEIVVLSTVNIILFFFNLLIWIGQDLIWFTQSPFHFSILINFLIAFSGIWSAVYKITSWGTQFVWNIITFLQNIIF